MTPSPHSPQERLIWNPKGWGTLLDEPIPDELYTDSYLKVYDGLAKTHLGVSLTIARKHFVQKHWNSTVVDFGSANGAFVDSMRGMALGYDIIPEAAERLQQKGRFVDPWTGVWPAMTFWDSLEHLPDPAAILRRVRRWVFVSLPIFADRDHVLRSKHFKPGEHLWYWTAQGLVDWMKEQGFTLAEATDIETRLGREDIGSFAFKRTEQPALRAPEEIRANPANPDTESAKVVENPPNPA